MLARYTHSHVLKSVVVDKNRTLLLAFVMMLSLCDIGDMGSRHLMSMILLPILLRSTPISISQVIII